MPLLFEAARNFLRSASGDALRRFENFRAENAWWLDDFVLFDALRARHKLESWNQWPRDSGASRAGLRWRRHGRNWPTTSRFAAPCSLRSTSNGGRCDVTARERSIRVVGDIAIFVNLDSADVWTHPELFRLNENLEPEVVAGVPPDFFSKTASAGAIRSTAGM